MDNQSTSARLSHDLGVYNKTEDRLTEALAAFAGTKRATPEITMWKWKTLTEPEKWQEWNSATPEEQDEIRELERLGGQYGG